MRPVTLHAAASQPAISFSCHACSCCRRRGLRQLCLRQGRGTQAKGLADILQHGRTLALTTGWHRGYWYSTVFTADK